MKYIIASDIHGSAHWCRKLVENFHREKADRLLLLGDLLMGMIDPRISFVKKEGAR